MKKALLIVAAAALIPATSFSGAAIAQMRGDQTALASEPSGATANQIIAQFDARTAAIKADLRLTPDQEKLWPGFESALHGIDKSRADRRVAVQADHGQDKGSQDVIGYLSNEAKLLSERSNDVKTLADAAQPFYASLDDQQKKRFTRVLIRVSRE
jgi:hypothetical protein